MKRKIETEREREREKGGRISKNARVREREESALRQK